MAISNSVSLPTPTETDYFSFLIDYATQHNFSVALWKLPNASEKRLAISRKHEFITYTTLLEDLPTGFIFAPFDSSADRIFLKADLYFSFSDDQLNPPETPLEITSHEWISALPVNKNIFNNNNLIYSNPKVETSTTDRDLFLRLVRNGIREIEQGTFEKIVLSRTLAVELAKDFDVGQAFGKLCDSYSNALISFVSVPEIGSWLGASPELLVSVDHKNTFKTAALAGTQPYLKGTDLRSVAWTQKDIEEQALVERYIISCFKKIRLREYEEHGPRTVVAGNLLHLKSDFTVDMQSTNFPQLGSVMLQLLHPTSAVCGVPLDAALEFLHKHEGHNRQFYTGYLGPVNTNDGINIFVNLRCMQLIERSAILYAGAGITQDSIPEKEWEETELKLDTLLRVIN